MALGWLELHESGTFVKCTQAGADLFAQNDAADASASTTNPIVLLDFNLEASYD
jgi:hypothetical protein